MCQNLLLGTSDCDIHFKYHSQLKCIRTTWLPVNLKKKRKFALKTALLGFCLTLLHCERLKQQIFEASVGSVCVPCFCDYGFSILKNKMFLRTEKCSIFLDFHETWQWILCSFRVSVSPAECAQNFLVVKTRGFSYCWNEKSVQARLEEFQFSIE